MSVRVGVPFRSTVPGCDSCFRPSRVLVPVAVVPLSGRAGVVCPACHDAIRCGDVSPVRWDSGPVSVSSDGVRAVVS